MRQKSEQLELALEARGEASHGQRSGEAPTTSGGDERSGGDHRLMEQVVARANALAALKRVKQNRGSPGVDGMTVDDLTPYLVARWEAIREQLLAGSYQPQPVKQQEIPKPGGGTRTLGIQLKQWKRGTTVYRELRARQVPERVTRAVAAHARRWWAMAAHGGLQTALPTSYFDGLGVPRLAGR